MNKISYRRGLLCLLLCIVLLPLPPARAEVEARLVTINAEGLFEDQYYLTELLLCGDRYYIRPEEAAAFAGLELKQRSPQAVYGGKYVSVNVPLDSIPSVNWQGQDYYELEAIMEQLQVFIMERDGNLVFNSVQNNLDCLLVFLKDSLLSGKYDADYLDDIPYIKDVLKDEYRALIGDSIGHLLYYIARVHMAIRELKINIYGTYREDVRSLLVKLVSVDDEGGINRFCANTAIADKKLKRAAAFLLEDDQQPGNITNLPEGRINLLFGTRGRLFIQDVQAQLSIQSQDDMLAFLFKLYFNEHKLDNNYDTLNDWKMPSVLFDLGKITVSDLISTSKYYIDVRMADFNYIRDLSLVMDAYDPELSLPLDMERRNIIVEQANDLLAIYNQYIGEKTGEIITYLASQFLESIRDDLTGDIFTKMTMTSPETLMVQYGTLVITALLDYFWHTDTTAKMSSILQMYEYVHIQNLFEDCLSNLLDDLRPEDAETCISAAKLYLKCSWNSIDLFSYDNLKFDGIPTNTMKARIDSLLDELMCFIPNEFIVIKPEKIPGGSLKEQNTAKHLPGDNPLAPYITICYEDHFCFDSDWDGTIECTYEIPQVTGLFCSDEVNDLILSGFCNYVTTGNNNSYTVHFNPPYLFTDIFSVDHFTTSTDWAGNILTEYRWEANIYNDILSIRITRMHYNPGNLAFLLEPEYDVINIDLLTGHIVKSEDVLWMIGIEEWDMQERIRNGIYELFDGFHDDDRDIFLQETFNENSYSAILERGFYLSPDGVQVWVYAYMSKYGYKYILTLGI